MVASVEDGVTERLYCIRSVYCHEKIANGFIHGLPAVGLRCSY